MLALLAFVVLPQEPAVPPLRLGGQVVDARGEIVPAAEVWAAWATDPTEVLARSRTDGEGRYQLRIPVGRPIRVHGRANGTAQRHLWLHDDAATEAPLMTLWDGVTLRGKIVDARGQPVAGAHVAVGSTRAEPVGLDTVEGITDANGRYAIEHAPLGEAWVSAWAPGFAAVFRTAWIGRGGDEDFAFGDGAPLGFTARVGGLPAGVAAKDWLVDLSHSSGPERVLPRVLQHGRLDENGEWRIAGLPADQDFHVKVSDPQERMLVAAGHWSRQRPSERIELAATEAAQSQVTWNVLLHDPSGQPIAGERLRLGIGGTRAIAITDAGGRASITAAVIGAAWTDARMVDSSRWVIVEADPARPPAQLRPEERGNVTLVPAVPAAGLRGRLVGVDGQPLGNTVVVVEDWQGMRSPRWLPFGAARTDAAGDFTIAGMPPKDGPLRLRIASVRALEAIGPLVSGQVQDLGKVAIEPAGAIEGVVRSAGGQPMPGARVFLVRKQQPEDRAELVAGADGKFRLSPATGGPWQCGVYWHDRGDVEWTDARANVVPGEVVVVEVVSKRE